MIAMALRGSARSQHSRATLHAVAVACGIAAAAPTPAEAQLGFSGGLDGGVTLPQAHVRAEGTLEQLNDPRPTVALGIDVAGYYFFAPTLGAGLAIGPTFFFAGPEPSPGLNFALAPRFVWRPGDFHLAVDAGLALSAFNDRCAFESFRSTSCPPTEKADPTGVGLALALAPLFRAAHTDEFDFLIGPAVRYQRAHYDYVSAAGGFDLQVFQLVFGLRFLGRVVEEPIASPTPSWSPASASE